MSQKIKIIGLGGIGSYLCEPLCRYVSHQHKNPEVTLIDGDVYEEKNSKRQVFSERENKAKHSSHRLKQSFPNILFKHKAEYINEDNVSSLIRENDLVFLCVDNHNTRKIVSDRCEELDNVTLISGGNDVIDGNVIYYHRKDGNDVTKSPTALHPAIANPKDKHPSEIAAEMRDGCEHQIEENPQLLFTNFAAASHMLNVYYAHEQGKASFEQVFFDIVTQSSLRKPDLPAQSLVFSNED